ncbi:hypothetical protein [Phormidium sp. CCY1219]|nr:hypothetical protein [Phormidium sp. CCY1219]
MGVENDGWSNTPSNADGEDAIAGYIVGENNFGFYAIATIATLNG